MKKIKILFLIITLVSFFIRIYKADKYPPLLWDEASNGYNAYSISKTGQDEYGKTLPLVFKSFGDYKPGFYVYLSIPFITIFGLNELSVRLPSIILGSLTPFIVYLLISTINPKKRNLGIVSAILLCFTPFHIHLSRGGWETNILTFEITLACYFFFLWNNQKNSKFLLYSSILFSLSLYTYQSAKMLSLLIIFCLIIVNVKHFLSKKIYIASFILPLIISSLPIVYGLIFSSDSNRLKVLSIFSYPRDKQEESNLISYSSQIQFNLFNNQLIFSLRSVLHRYFNHFSPKFLFFSGDWQNARHSAIYTGLLLLPSLIFLPIGFFSLKRNTLDILFLLWLIISPIPSSLTRDSVHAVRSANLVIPLTYFSSQGVIIVFNFLRNILSPYLTFIGISFVYFIFFCLYQDLYFNHTIKVNPYQYLYGHKQAVDYVISNQDKYDQIFFSDFYNQPYIFYLFFSKYPPKLYQKQANLISDSSDTGRVEQIDKVHFGNIGVENCLTNQKILCIISEEEKNRAIDTLKKYPNQLYPISPINNISTFYAIIH